MMEMNWRGMEEGIYETWGSGGGAACLPSLVKTIDS